MRGGRAYYNEHDPFAAVWLRELIADGLIAPGEVDERSVEDVIPSDLAGFVQCHFFAGIGVWSLALRQAGWPDDAPIWTGSCPCQPFSAAGKGGGFADERHLWPSFHWLIEQCNPQLVVGEQVASKDGLAWLDLVSADVEASGYAFGAADTCAAGFGAPHIRQRLYWMADAQRSGRQSFAHDRPASILAMEHGSAQCGDQFGDHGSSHGRLADSGSQRRDGQPICLLAGRQDKASPQIAGVGSTYGMGHAGCSRAGRDAGASTGAQEGVGRAGQRDGHCRDLSIATGANDRPGPLNGLWRDADWLFCTDGKWRPVSAGTFPLAPAGTVRNRVGMLRGAGNAINLAQAQGFIEAVIEVRAQPARLAA